MARRVAKSFGFFRLLFNNWSGAEVLVACRQKDVIGKGVDDLNNRVDMRRLRIHDSETAEGETLLSLWRRFRKQGAKCESC